MKFLPLGHRILVRQLKLEEIDPSYKQASASGIILTLSDDLKREQNAVDVGEVLAIGSTAFKDFGGDWNVSVGDTVYFAKYAGKILIDHTQPDTQYIVLNDEDLVAKVNE